ncbi:CvpA family protein [Rhodanobacter sp. T12-5]|uniref:CvpA family protein n=1 Tax=Rhodanobacter sp. T12-5 TaxID=2024611 RepID=UPI0011EC790E|nr:CvpA family protein [Rhodanobacter sp. T12-5]KAA0068830.1 CvpA family protein [Rhodanobacter sp. T12-5]
MNWTDYIILGILGLSILIGLWRGLVSEVLALVIWVAAFWAAWVFGPVVAAHFEGVIHVPSVRIIVGYGICFVAVLIFGALLRFVIRKLIEGTGLSGTDRLLGMLFGFARGVLLVTLLVFLVGFTAFTRDPWWQQSVLLPQFQRVAAWLEQRVPASVGEHLHPAAMLDHLPRLPTSLLSPISGATPAPTTTAVPQAIPAAVDSAAARPTGS